MYRIRGNSRAAEGQLYELDAASNLQQETDSVFQGHNRLITPAERGHMLKAAVWLLNQHDWTIAEHSMASFGHVPHSADARLLRRRVVERRTQRLRELGTG
jgi:hypothetical protein